MDKAKLDAQEKSQGYNSVIDLHKHEANLKQQQNVSRSQYDQNVQNHELKLEELRQKTQQRLAEQRKTQKPKE